jgi:hypothetical protein
MAQISVYLTRDLDNHLQTVATRIGRNKSQLVRVALNLLFHSPLSADSQLVQQEIANLQVGRGEVEGLVPVPSTSSPSAGEEVGNE